MNWPFSILTDQFTIHFGVYDVEHVETYTYLSGGKRRWVIQVQMSDGARYTKTFDNKRAAAKKFKEIMKKCPSAHLTTDKAGLMWLFLCV